MSRGKSQFSVYMLCDRIRELQALGTPATRVTMSSATWRYVEDFARRNSAGMVLDLAAAGRRTIAGVPVDVIDKHGIAWSIQTARSSN